MSRGHAAVCCALLLLVAVPRETLGACAEDLRFDGSGAIARWDVCHGEARQSFAAAEQPRLELRIAVDGAVLDGRLAWQKVEVGPAETNFRAFEPAAGLDIRRVYRLADDGSLQQSILVANLSGAPVSGIRLLIAPGVPPAREQDAGGGLADYVYGFQRFHVAAAGGGWQRAAAGARSRVYASVSRHRAFVIEAAGDFTLRQDERPAAATGGEGTAAPWLLEFDVPALDPGATYPLRLAVSALPTDAGTLAASGYEGLAYAEHWLPLSLLCRWMEAVLAALASAAGGPAVAIVLVALLVRLVTMPVTAWSARRQDAFARANAKIEPEIAKVRKDYKGAEQSERILAIYRENGLSPLSGLAGSLGLFVQIPFLLAVFNVTTVSSLFAGASFLWIDDLSLPDTLAVLPFTIPLLGNALNALPLLLGALFVFSSAGGRGQAGTSSKVPLIVTSLIILAFYSFAAALVLYWLTVSAFQVVERAVIQRRAAREPAYG